MTVYRNPIQVIERTIGNLEPIGITIQDIDGTAINLSTGSPSWSVELYDSDGAEVGTARSGTIVAAAAGELSFVPVSDDVASARRLYIYAIDDSSPSRRFPYDGGRLQLNVKSLGDAT